MRSDPDEELAAWFELREHLDDEWYGDGPDAA